MTTLSHLPGYDAWKLASPPYLDPAPDEPCDRCGKDICADEAIKVRMGGRGTGYWGYYCADCAVPVERCDQCHLLRCACGEDD